MGPLVKDHDETISSDDSTPSTPEPTLPQLAVAESLTIEKAEPHDIDRGRRGSSLSIATVSEDEVHDAQVPPHRSRSRAHSSVRSVVRDAVIVPREERRGLFARFAVIAEVTEPHDYTRKKKWTITFIVAVAAAAAPMGSAIILPALSEVQQALDAGAVIVNLSVALYMLSMSIFPLWWSSFSETLGRRTIYIVSFTLFLIFNILAAVSVNIGMFIVTRLLAGGAAASVQAVGAGTIADVWEVKERAPFIGGALTLGLGWRSPQWFLAIFGFCVLVMIIICLPETLKVRQNLAAAAEAEVVDIAVNEKPEALTRVSTHKSVQMRTKKLAVMCRRALLDPLHIIVYLKFPAVAMCVGYASIVFGSLYVLNISVEYTFSRSPYNYSSLVIGLLYLPNSFGYFLSSIFGGPWVDKIMHREARKAGRYDDKGRLKFIPEDRMRENAWIGAILFPCGMLIYGWTARYGVNIAAPMVANFLFGLGSMLVFAMVTTMLTEFMPRKASHGIALNNFVRNILSCVGTIVAQPLIVAISNGWLFTILGLVCLFSGIVTILVMKHFGARWREGMEERMEKAMGD
ncbi:hypothetical protein AMS68_005535 [Peltaster fructicola]|uniref:Major facilitator superfamily (MFS) profile domain-containing protein n=1 Tax=Peltaster fructicola TaxID=286661 RepID=A0A6H0XZJ8_9PEZI|nr:hypothetical protein AMS68_005535 [Peltaster fructicola]